MNYRRLLAGAERETAAARARDVAVLDRLRRDDPTADADSSPSAFARERPGRLAELADEVSKWSDEELLDYLRRCGPAGDNHVSEKSEV